MKKYKTRPGVVLTSICGERMLVSAKANNGICPYVVQINESSAYLWNKLRDGADEEDLMRFVTEDFEVDDSEVVKEAIRGFISQMLEMNYLLEAGE